MLLSRSVLSLSADATAKLQRSAFRGRDASMSNIARWATTALLLLLAVAAGQPATGEEPRKPPAGDNDKPSVHSVQAQVLTSTERPAVRLKFANGFPYAGSQTFI